MQFLRDAHWITLMLAADQPQILLASKLKIQIRLYYSLERSAISMSAIKICNKKLGVFKIIS